MGNRNSGRWPRKQVVEKPDYTLTLAAHYLLMTGLPPNTHVCGVKRGKWACQCQGWSSAPCLAGRVMPGSMRLLMEPADVGGIWERHREALIAEAADYGFTPAGLGARLKPAVTAAWRKEFMEEHGR
jgi:hypothetical protein